MKADLLVRRLQHLSACYYDGRPLVSDAEYDAFRDELELIAPEHQFLSEIGAPAGSMSTAWPEHRHVSLIGSLNKIAPNSDDPDEMKREFLKWAEDKGPILLSEKYDGSTVVATYKNGAMQTLATRGDGIIGEDITINASKLKDVPLRVPDMFSGEVRGEAILFISDFEKHFKPEGFKNARNTANGKVRDQKTTGLQKYIRVLWFDVIPHDRDLELESEKWMLLQRLMRVKCEPHVMSADETWQMYEYYRDEYRSHLDYEIDGLVAKVNDLDNQESFGITNNRPKGTLALKFPPVKKVTVLKDVIWQQGLTGRINPVAILEPIDLGGVTIRRASLCNIDEIKRLKIQINDKVLVSRRNDVIPKIEKLVEASNNRQLITPPTHWDGEELVRDGAYLVTMNMDSQGMVFGNIMTWIKVMKMKGFGPAVVRGLIDEGITNIADFYKAGVEIFDKAANSDKTGKKLFETKEKNYEVRLGAFLAGLNIPTLGRTNSTRLEKEFKTLDNVLAADVQDLQGVRGIKTNAKKIKNGLDSRADLIKELRSKLIIADLDESGILAGKSICITGELSHPRALIQDWVRENGGEIKSGVSKTLSYLLTNIPNSGTSKNKKADKYSVPKITEEELYELVGNNPI